MANAEHVEIVRGGADAIGAWRERNPDARLHLEMADLSGADLSEADLSGADLSDADFRGANIAGACLSWARLMGANLTGANLWCADLRAADLRGANLTGANLWRADLRAADLTGAKLTLANLTEADLAGADVGESTVGFGAFAILDLSRVRGLETVRHVGPSTVGVDTLYKSRGKIPEGFLRGCGVPAALIAYLPSLIGALQRSRFCSYLHCSCFISYSHVDEEFANRLHSRMRDEGLRVWHAPEHMKGSERFEGDAGRRDLLLVVLSETSMKSSWVPSGIYHARLREEGEERRILFPIRMIPFEAVQAWKWPPNMANLIAVELQRHFIPDFSNWKNHDSFEAAFKRLLVDLTAHDLVGDFRP